jgi:hypothetical protein
MPDGGSGADIAEAMKGYWRGVLVDLEESLE